jgi:hypothetical protein
VEVASVPGGEAAEPQGGAPEAPEATPQEAPTGDPRIDALLERQGEQADAMRALMQRIPEPQPEPEPDFAQQFESLYDDNGYADPAQMEQFIQQRIQQGVEQAVGPLAQQFNEMRQGMNAEKLDALQSRYPALQNPETAAAVVDQVVTLAQAWGTPELANNHDFVEMVHLSMQGRSAAPETPAGQGPESHLETGGGGSPSEPEGDPFDAIMAKSAKHALDF